MSAPRLSALLAFATAAVLFLPVHAAAFDTSDWDALLQETVHADGVDYEALLAQRHRLDAFVESLADARPRDWSRDAQMAFWINAYNAVMIQLVLDHWPIDSVLDIDKVLKLVPTGGVFHQERRVAGIDRSLDDIEHRILRPRYEDPRIHAAINCASVSCPPLWNRAYTAKNLDAELDRAMTQFLLDPERNHLHEQPPRVSKIFDWFKKDFVNHSGSVWAYVRSAVPDSVRATLPQTARPGFLPYDWELNRRP